MKSFIQFDFIKIEFYQQRINIQQGLNTLFLLLYYPKIIYFVLEMTIDLNLII